MRPTETKPSPRPYPVTRAQVRLALYHSREFTFDVDPPTGGAQRDSDWMGPVYRFLGLSLLARHLR